MSPADFAFLSAFLRQTSGLVLTEDKAYLLENRLQPLVRSNDLETLDDLVGLLRAGKKPGLDREIVEAMTTNESFFFRDINPFDNFRDNVLPKLLSARASSMRIRIWCAAASTGQEPYSLAMLLQELGNSLAGWRIELLATDLDTEVLARAKAGVYTQFEVQRGLPMQMLVKYFEKEGEKWQISAAIRNMVTYREHNLLGNASALGGVFDVVFCRNVLIYFDPETKTKVLDDMSTVMAPDSYLFLGGAETVLGVSESFAPVEGLRGVYAKPGAASGVKASATGLAAAKAASTPDASKLATG